MLYGAVISDCGKYRYSLWRIWDSAKPVCVYIMLNPSTADASTDDATIRSCIRLARAWGCGGIHVVNVFAFRATDPKALPRDQSAIAEGGKPERNTRHIAAAMEGERITDAGDKESFVAFATVAAWGACERASDRPGFIRELARLNEVSGLKCLGKTKSGAPKHPLYARTDTVLIDF